MKQKDAKTLKVKYRVLFVDKLKAIKNAIGGIDLVSIINVF